MLYLLCLLVLFNKPPTIHDIYYKRIGIILKKFNGDIGIAIKELSSGEFIYYNETKRFPLASVAKLPVLVELYSREAEKKIDLNEKYSIPINKIAVGSGILAQLDPNIPLSLRDMSKLMICISDCSAYNLLLEILGVNNINLWNRLFHSKRYDKIIGENCKKANSK